MDDNENGNGVKEIHTPSQKKPLTKQSSIRKGDLSELFKNFYYTSDKKVLSTARAQNLPEMPKKQTSGSNPDFSTARKDNKKSFGSSSKVVLKPTSSGFSQNTLMRHTIERLVPQSTKP